MNRDRAPSWATHRSGDALTDWVRWVALKKKSERDKCWQRCEKLEPLCFAGGNVKGYSHGEKRSGGPQKIRQNYHMI